MGESSETEIDSTLPEAISGTPQTENPETENPDPLINPGNEAIEDAESAAGDEIDDTSTTEAEGLSEAELEETDSASEDDTDDPEVLPETTAEDADSTPEENSDDPETTAENAEVESDDNSDDAEAVTESTAEETQPEEEDDAEEESLAEDGEVAVEPDATETSTLEDFDFTQIQSGIFTANSDGIVQIDYLFDDGKFAPEVAIFSLEGMDELWSADDPKQFIAEAARRSISNSELGGIAINDATQGARFSDAKNRFNSGEYTGVKTLQMRPGDRFAVMVVPNGSVQDLLDKIEMGQLPRPLFSIAEFNRNGDAYLVQATNGNGDGDVFAFEDLRLDLKSDRDFNDIVFQIRGATGAATPLSDILDPTQGWWSKDVGQAVISYGEPYVTPVLEEESIDLPADEPVENTETEVSRGDSAGLETTITRDDDTAEAGLETTIVREDEVVAEESTDTEEEETVVDAPTDTTSAESESEASEEVEDTTPAQDETPEALTGVAGVPTISTSPPEPYDFAKQNQPAIVVIDTGFNGNNPDIEYSNITSGTDFVTGDTNSFLAPGEGSEHGTHILGIIAATQNNGVGINGINDDAPIVAIRAVGSGRISEAIIEGVDRIQASGQPNGIINLSLDLTQTNPDGSITTRYELTPKERAAIEYARQNGVILAVAAGNDGGVMSVLGQASQEFDNIITVGAAERVNGEIADSKAFDRSDYSSFGRGLDIVAPGGTVDNPVLSTVEDGVGTMAGTSVATAKVTGAASQIWAANSGLNYRQVIEILKLTSTDLDTPNWDGETGFGLLNIDAAVKVAKVTAPEEYAPPVSFIPETWSGEGIVTPGERAASTEFMGRYYDWFPYTIQSGDTLSGLASATMGSGSATYYNFIAQYNGIPNPDLIYAGDTILLPYEVAPPPPPEDNGYTPPDDGYNPPPDDGYNPPPDDGYTPPPDDGYTPPPTSVIINGYTIDGSFYPVFQQYQGTLGNPIEGVQTHSTGATYQRFDNGSIVSSQYGTFPLYGAIGQEYLNESGLDGWLDEPTSGEIGQGNGVIKQTFENGYIIWNGSCATAYQYGKLDTQGNSDHSSSDAGNQGSLDDLGIPSIIGVDIDFPIDWLDNLDAATPYVIGAALVTIVVAGGLLAGAGSAVLATINELSKIFSKAINIKLPFPNIKLPSLA